ncbi:unnamed protein product, partial [Prorocentrum cordatum]
VGGLGGPGPRRPAPAPLRGPGEGWSRPRPDVATGRIAQLDFLIDKGFLSPPNCLRLVVAHPGRLTSYDVREVFARDGLLVVNKPFNRLLYPKKQFPREVAIVDALKAERPGVPIRLCHRLDYG